MRLQPCQTVLTCQKPSHQSGLNPLWAVGSAVLLLLNGCTLQQPVELQRGALKDGTKIDNTDWQEVVWLGGTFHKEENAKKLELCGGVQIDAYTILTAAHCWIQPSIDDTVDSFKVMRPRVNSEIGRKDIATVPKEKFFPYTGLRKPIGENDIDLGVLCMPQNALDSYPTINTAEPPSCDDGEAALWKATMFGKRKDDEKYTYNYRSPTQKVGVAPPWPKRLFTTDCYGEGGDSGSPVFKIEDGSPTHKLIGIYVYRKVKDSEDKANLHQRVDLREVRDWLDARKTECQRLAGERSEPRDRFELANLAPEASARTGTKNGQGICTVDADAGICPTCGPCSDGSCNPADDTLSIDCCDPGGECPGPGDLCLSPDG